MEPYNFMYFSCPKCLSRLQRSGQSYVCASGHSFDIARAGYVNLLPPTGGRDHGDNKEMIAARRDFLNTGHYMPLLKCITDLAASYFTESAVVLDVGCGDGYYTNGIESVLRSRDGGSRVCAFDISKDAVRSAAKRNSNISFAVASAYHIPAADCTFDGAVNIFSPLAKDETRRVLTAGGIFIVAFPGEEHLFGLKSEIYDTPYKNEPAALEMDGFELVESRRIRYEMKLSSESEIRSLFMMTPYAYRTGSRGRERVFSLSSLTTDADFYVCVYRKTT